MIKEHISSKIYKHNKITTSRRLGKSEAKW